MKIARVVFDVDMRCNFEGLRDQLKKEKVDTDTLSKDYVVICLNRKQNCFKLLIDNTYIVFYKNGNRRIDLGALAFLPQRFGGSEMEYNQAVEKMLRTRLHIPLERPKKTGKVRVKRKIKVQQVEARA